VFWETFPDPGIGKAKQANEPMAGDIGRLFYKKVWAIRVNKWAVKILTNNT